MLLETNGHFPNEKARKEDEELRKLYQIFKKEHESIGNAYFIMKKTYAFYCKNDNKYIMKMKGIPQNTIKPNGDRYDIVFIDHYEELYKGNSVEYGFNNLRKNLFNDKTFISTNNMSRVVRANQRQKEYI